MLIAIAARTVIVIFNSLPASKARPFIAINSRYPREI